MIFSALGTFGSVTIKPVSCVAFSLFLILFTSRPSNVLTILKLKGKKGTGFSSTNGNASPRFSEIVSGGGAGTLISAGKRGGATGVQKKLQQKMNKTHQPATNNKQGVGEGDFKIGQVTSGLPTTAVPYSSCGVSYVRQLNARV
jgi:hypothetical protein